MLTNVMNEVSKVMNDALQIVQSHLVHAEVSTDEVNQNMVIGIGAPFEVPATHGQIEEANEIVNPKAASEELDLSFV